MGTSTTDGSVLAHLMAGSAHGLRNHVATLRSVVQLQDDPEVAEALAAATRAVQVTVERAVALARIELGASTTTEVIDLGELVSLALRRARREGVELEEVTHTFDAGAVVVPGTVAERLFTDLVHYAGATPAISANVQGNEVDIAFALHAGGPPVGVGAVLHVLARACGGTLHLVEDEALLTLPLAPVVSAE